MKLNDKFCISTSVVSKHDEVYHLIVSDVYADRSFLNVHASLTLIGEWYTNMQTHLNESNRYVM